MKRRSALAGLAGTVCGLVILPAWATGWTAEALRPTRAVLSRGLSDLLADVVETIIPATDTPGAKALNVHQFVEKMVADCYPPAAQETLQKGLTTLTDLTKTGGKSFPETDSAQRMTLLTQMSQSADPAQKEFVKLVKDLTIRGYLNSEYVMNNLTHYEMVPGRYHGCVPVKSATSGK